MQTDHGKRIVEKIEAFGGKKDSLDRFIERLELLPPWYEQQEDARERHECNVTRPVEAEPRELREEEEAEPKELKEAVLPPGVQEWMLQPTIHELELQRVKWILHHREQGFKKAPKPDEDLPVVRTLPTPPSAVDERAYNSIKADPYMRKLMDETYVGPLKKWRRKYGYSWFVPCPECMSVAHEPCSDKLCDPPCIRYNPHSTRRAAAKVWVVDTVRERGERIAILRMREIRKTADCKSVEILEGIEPPYLEDTPLFEDPRVDKLFEHLDMSWWDKLPYEERMERYWACPHEAARRRRAQMVKEYDEGKRKVLPNQHRESGGGKWLNSRLKEAPPLLGASEPGYSIKREPPLLSKDGNHYQRPRWPLDHYDGDRAFTGLWYLHTTWHAGNDRRYA
jgi:hypothetical protein